MDDGLDDLSQEEQSAIRDVIERVDVDRIAEATGVSRRQALQVIAATGVGIAVGGIGTNALVGNAQAAASTSDSDGNVGLPSNRVDVFADGVDSKSLNTDQLKGGVANNQTVERIGGERIETKSASGASAVTFTSGITSDFGIYTLEFAGVVPGTDQDELEMQLSTDGGLSWITSSYSWVFDEKSAKTDSTETISGSPSNDALRIARNVGNQNDEAINGTIKMYSPSQSNRLTWISSQTTLIDNNGTFSVANGGGVYNTAEAIDAVRLIFQNGDINADTVSLYGDML